MRGLFCLVSAPALAFVIGGQMESPPTFNRDIRPILAQKCVSCHHESGLGPFALQTYEQTRKRGDLVRQVALTGQMPPTDAQSDFASLTPHQRLTSLELRVIQEWYRLGMPKGKESPRLEPPVKETPPMDIHTWCIQAGKGRSLPSEGRNVRTVYEVKVPAGGFGRLNKFDFRPNAPKAVRQAILTIQKVGHPIPFTSTGIAPGAPAMAWSEGYNLWQGSDGYLKVERGDRLWLQIRSVPTGKTETASGLVITDARRGQVEAKTKTLGHTDIHLQPDAQLTPRSEWVLDRDIDLISAIPEARFTTEQLTLTATFAGQTKILLQVLTWDPIWPGAYNFPKPIRLKKGTTIAYEAYINNSKHGHAAEEDQPKPVKYGPNPQDELFWCHLTYIPR